MIESDQYKFNAVNRYLSMGFPEFSIEQAYDGERMAATFSVENKDEKYVVKFVKKYWDRCDANTLFKHMKNLDVANALRKNPQKNIIVNRSVDLGFEPK
jgi:hypothetical protein